MEPLMMVNVGVVGANAIMLTLLVVLYLRMLRDVPSRFTWGLLSFASVLLFQGLVQLYFYFTMQMYFAGGVEMLVLVQNGLATVASAFLVYVTFAPVSRSKAAPA